MCSPGQEGKRGVSQKVKFIVPAGCAELSLTMYLLILTEKNFWLPSSK